ncbi:hypothetical protein GCM10022259_22120 [Aquimarina mytili]
MISTYTIPLKKAEPRIRRKPIELIFGSKPLIINTPINAIKKNNHCTGFTCSLKKNTARIVAKIGERYRNETAEPMGK